MSRLGRRALLRLAVGVSAGAFLSGCGAFRFESGDRARLAISPGNQTLWRYLRARNTELLRSKGHVVELENVPTETELQRGFVEGRFDAIATLVPAMPGLVQQGVPVRFFLPLAWLKEGYPLIVPESSSIQQVTDLPGRRVASFPLDHPGFAYWRAFLLKHHGLRAEQVSTVQTLDPQDLLANRQVDAAFVGGSGWAALQTTGGFRKVTDLQSEFQWLTGSNRVPVFAGLVARAEWPAEHERLVADLLTAAREGLELYHRDRSAFLDVVTGERAWASIPRDENAAIARYLGYDAVRPERVRLTPEDVDDYRRFFLLLADAGVVTSAPDAETLFYLPKLTR